MGEEWGHNHRRSPMDTGGSGQSGGGNKKMTVFALLAFLGLPVGLTTGVALYLLHGYGVI